MKKNQKIATLIKCLNEKLPVLKTLAQRRPDIYKSPNCILCNKGSEEDQNHLAICEKHEQEWRNAEDTAINLAWPLLQEETQRNTSKDQLKKLFWGISIEEKIESRSKIIKGLIQEKAKKMLQDLTQSLKEAKEFIIMLTNTAWNAFFENIWKKRCDLVTMWEKTLGISNADKKKRFHGEKEGSGNKKTQKQEVVVDRTDQNRTIKEKKEEDNNRIQET